MGKKKQQKEPSVLRGKLSVAIFEKWAEEVRTRLIKKGHTFSAEDIRQIARDLTDGIQRTMDDYAKELSLAQPIVSAIVRHCITLAFAELDALRALDAEGEEANKLCAAILHFCDNMATALEHIFQLLMVIFSFFLFFPLFSSSSSLLRCSRSSQESETLDTNGRKIEGPFLVLVHAFLDKIRRDAPTLADVELLIGKPPLDEEGARRHAKLRSEVQRAFALRNSALAFQVKLPVLHESAKVLGANQLNLLEETPALIAQVFAFFFRGVPDEVVFRLFKAKGWEFKTSTTASLRLGFALRVTGSPEKVTYCSPFLVDKDLLYAWGEEYREHLVLGENCWAPVYCFGDNLANKNVVDVIATAKTCQVILCRGDKMHEAYCSPYDISVYLRWLANTHCGPKTRTVFVCFGDVPEELAKFPCVVLQTSLPWDFRDLTLEELLKVTALNLQSLGKNGKRKPQTQEQFLKAVLGGTGVSLATLGLVRGVTADDVHSWAAVNSHFWAKERNTAAKAAQAEVVESALKRHRVAPSLSEPSDLREPVPSRSNGEESSFKDPKIFVEHGQIYLLGSDIGSPEDAFRALSRNLSQSQGPQRQGLLSNIQQAANFDEVLSLLGKFAGALGLPKEIVDALAAGKAPPRLVLLGCSNAGGETYTVSNGPSGCVMRAISGCYRLPFAAIESSMFNIKVDALFHDASCSHCTPIKPPFCEEEDTWVELHFPGKSCPAECHQQAREWIERNVFSVTVAIALISKATGQPAFVIPTGNTADNAARLVAEGIHRYNTSATHPIQMFGQPPKFPCHPGFFRHLTKVTQFAPSFRLWDNAWQAAAAFIIGVDARVVNRDELVAVCASASHYWDSKDLLRRIQEDNFKRMAELEQLVDSLTAQTRKRLGKGPGEKLLLGLPGIAMCVRELLRRLLAERQAPPAAALGGAMGPEGAMGAGGAMASGGGMASGGATGPGFVVGGGMPSGGATGPGFAVGGAMGPGGVESGGVAAPAANAKRAPRPYSLVTRKDCDRLHGGAYEWRAVSVSLCLTSVLIFSIRTKRRDRLKQSDAHFKHMSVNVLPSLLPTTNGGLTCSGCRTTTHSTRYLTSSSVTSTLLASQSSNGVMRRSAAMRPKQRVSHRFGSFTGLSKQLKPLLCA
jgi:hypothetical protein